MIHILVIALLTFHPANDPLKDKNYKLHAVEIQRGDGVFSLLRRYKLSASECNIEQFYQLNKKAHYFEHLGKECQFDVHLQ